MKTNDQLETLIQNLIERMNRVEANVAQLKPSVAFDPAAAKSAIDVAITALNAAQAAYGSQSESYARIVADLRNVR